MTDQTQRLVELYDELIERLYETKLELEKSSQALDLEEEIERLIEIEQGIERLTLDEASLLSTWLKRDLKDLRSYLVETGKGVHEWLAQESHLLGEQFIHWLKQVADPTLLDARTLEEDLASRENPPLYHAGELAMAGRFICSSCEKPVQVVATSRLDACHRCDGRVFIR